jgi:hypothetical protein
MGPGERRDAEDQGELPRPGGQPTIGSDLVALSGYCRSFCVISGRLVSFLVKTIALLTEMRPVTRTETRTTAEGRLTGTLARAHCNRATDCRCGQQLDVHSRAHCPRCGRSLKRL